MILLFKWDDKSQGCCGINRELAADFESSARKQQRGVVICYSGCGGRTRLKYEF
jgi:hypothetical protein